jgi:hypothetical protein
MQKRACAGLSVPQLSQIRPGIAHSKIRHPDSAPKFPP